MADDGKTQDPSPAPESSDDGNWQKLAGMIKSAVREEFGTWESKNQSQGSSTDSGTTEKLEKKKSFLEKLITG